jgi:hypothetical protein
VAVVHHDEISLAFEFVSSAAPTEHRAYVALDTGAVHWVSELNPLDEEVPDDLETSPRYVEIPHKNDFDLGAKLALRFAAKEIPDQYPRIDAFFRHRGAYARFKELLGNEGLLDKWYAFEAESTKRDLVQWCADNGIDLIDPHEEPSA